MLGPKSSVYESAALLGFQPWTKTISFLAPSSSRTGAPDCVAAAEVLCRKHGFTSGKSMDFTSAEECPVRTLLGQSDECTTVTFISRAMCQ